MRATGDQIALLRGPSTADLVHEELYRQIVALELPPGTRISEQEVARRIGSSRQPVRDAFYRLSKLGLLEVLAFGARAAFDDHVRIFEALCAGDPDRASAAMRAHLGRIADILAQLRSEHPAMFAGDRP